MKIEEQMPRASKDKGRREECVSALSFGGCVFISITKGEQLWQNDEKMWNL